MVATTTSTTASRDTIVDVLAEEGALRDGSDTLDSSRQLTVSLSPSNSGASFNPFGKWGYSPSARDSSSSILVEHGSSSQNTLSIILHRTIRVPDNADTNSLPPSLGSFPLFRVKDYTHNLPDELAQKGGIFFPMYQSEAMWMAFRANRPFALKIYVGGVNAVSGFPMVENEKTREKRARMLKEGKQIQDYVVTPDQPWLDGIVSEDGKIRQFVAQPKGSGFSVEAQVTGEEKVGGIQIEIIPINKNFPDEFDVRYKDKEDKVLTRTFKLQDRGITRDSTWANVKALISKEFGIAEDDQKLSQHTPTPTGAHYSGMDFDDSTRLGDVYFPAKFSTLAVEHTPPPVPTFTRGYARSGAFGSFGGGGPPGTHMMMACAAPPSPMGVNNLFQESHSPTDLSSQPTFGSATMSMQSSFGAPAPALRARATPKVKEMGLAAGGLIKQTINADPNPADVWDQAAAVLLHLQIFDPASYTDVTGNPAPDTPATQEEYAKHGWPYFEIWNEEKTGVKGDFDEVKSVAQLKKERALAAGEDAPAEEESVPVRVVTIGNGRPVSFKSTFTPLELMRKEMENLTFSSK
jgi:hypothetical protein